MVRENNNVNCVLAVNKIFLVGAIVCMTSVLVNLDDEKRARFFIFHTELENGDIEKILKLKEVVDCEIIIMDVREHLHYFKEVDFSNSDVYLRYYESFLRFLIFKILPEDVEKCFYLDSDLIVNCDLAELFPILEENKLIVAVKDPYCCKEELNNSGGVFYHLSKIEEFSNLLNETEDYTYFNAGFLLINVKLSKSMNIFEKLFKYLEKYPNLKFLDQDILNIVFSQNNVDKVVYLGQDYNLLTEYHYSKLLNKDLKNQIKLNAFVNPKIMHFIGTNKPWLQKPSLNYYDVWWKYFIISPINNHFRKKYIRFGLSVEKIFSLEVKERKYIWLNFIQIFRIKIKRSIKHYYIMGLKILKVHNY